MANMFIRQSSIKSKKTGGSYFTYRLVESVRIAGKVKQKTLLNLGKHFSIEAAHWSILAERISQIVRGETETQQELFGDAAPIDHTLELAAQRYAALVLQKLSSPVLTTNASEVPETDYETLDLNQLKVLQARSIGTESLALHALKQLQLDDKLRELGFNEKDVSAAIGNIIGRMLHPGSERETHRWLQQNSALDELLEQDFGNLSLDRLYRVADKLLENKTSIESHLGQRERSLFNLQRTIVLYDLTNTFFEGQAKGIDKAKHGRSKEKRSDCPLVTMGLVIDGDGFPLASEIFEGNVSEPKTLKTMLAGLTSSTDYQGAIVVLDAGIASQDNLDWLKENDYRYIVVSREKYKEKPDLGQGAVVVKPDTNDQVIAKYVKDPDSGEIRLYCHSEKREKKDSAIRSQFCQRFEEALTALSTGLSKKGTIKKYEKVLERVGRLKEKYSQIAHAYSVVVTTDDEKTFATSIVWSHTDDLDKKDRLAGVYCLRTDVTNLTEKELWETYVMLTDLEASFKSMKSELGLRPIYHQNENRVLAHLFITLLAYHIVHTLRVQFKHCGIDLSWHSIRNIMSSQHRVTVSAQTAASKQIFLRTTTQAEILHRQFFDALGISSDCLGVRKTIVGKICSAQKISA